MKIKIFIGWLLLIAGLSLIIWTLYSTYNIFTAKKSAPEIFKIEEQKALLKEDIVSQDDFQEEVRKMIESQFKEIIPSELLSKILNLMAWSILAGILIFGGSKFSSIGIKLMRKE